MVVGSFVVGACLMVLGWTKEIVAHFVEEGDFRKECTVTLAVLSIYAIDFAINAGELSAWDIWMEGLTGDSSRELQEFDCGYTACAEAAGR